MTLGYQNKHREFQVVAHDPDTPSLKSFGGPAIYRINYEPAPNAHNGPSRGTFCYLLNMFEHRAVELGPDTLAEIDEIEDWTQYVYPSDFIPLEQWHDGPITSAAGLADSSKAARLDRQVLPSGV